MLSVFAGLIITMVFVLTAAPDSQARPNPYPSSYKVCGHFNAGYKIFVYAEHMSCRKARKIQKEYWLAPDRRKVIHNGGSGAFGWVTLKRYPGWRCGSGSGGGSCTKGRKTAAYQN